MPATKSFVHIALSLGSQEKRIPISDATIGFLTALIWSGLLKDITQDDDQPFMYATLTSEGLDYLHRLE